MGRVGVLEEEGVGVGVPGGGVAGAVEVDKERGWYPHGLAETLADILALVRVERLSSSEG